MATSVPAGPQIDLVTIASVFGGGPPYPISNYYRGGAYVPNVSLNSAVPTSGQISFSNFYNATARIAIALNVASTSGYDVYTNRSPSYVAGISDITVTIPSGVTVGAGGGTYALLIPSSFNANDTINIVNKGYITGGGGPGGNGASIPSPPNIVGYNATHAIYVAPGLGPIVSINNTGTITGGGGGGGGGGAYSVRVFNPSANQYQTHIYGGGGGGGGAGSTAGSGGAGGPYQLAPASSAGSPGSLTGGGPGGAGSATNSGGPGGAAGAGGSAGTPSPSSPGAPGGSAGYYIIGGAGVTWIATGTLYGLAG